MQYDDAQIGRVALFCERLPWDSEFFGYGVARLSAVFPLDAPLHRPVADYAPALEQLLDVARRRNIRYLLAQIDPRDSALLRAVGTLGFSLIETRFYHYGPVIVSELVERLPIRLATPDDIPSLARTARSCVNPFDRFHADPFIDAEAAGRLMEKWIKESVLGRMADLVLVPDMPEPTAFVTYRYHREHWARWKVKLVQGVLSAVSPELMGWMDKLAPEVNHVLHEVGAEYSFGSTQATNRAIIFFAQEAGARFGRCEHIFRIVL